MTFVEHVIDFDFDFRNREDHIIRMIGELECCIKEAQKYTGYQIQCIIVGFVLQNSIVLNLGLQS